jgi:hypothetical protein
VSASKVRELIKRGDVEMVKALVRQRPGLAEFSGGAPVLERIKKSDSAIGRMSA